MLILQRKSGEGVAVYDTLINGQGTNGPNLYIKFDETSGSTMNATGLGGAPRTAGSYNDTYTLNQSGIVNDGGNSVEFTNGYGAIVGVGEYQAGGDLTFSAWVNLNSVGGSSQGLFHFGDSAGGPGNIGLLIYINSLGELTFESYDGAWFAHSADTALLTGTDYHIALVMDPGNQIKFYLNGAPDGTISITNGYGTSSDISMTVAALKTSGARQLRLNGKLDNLCTFKELLSDQDILDQYNAGS